MYNTLHNTTQIDVTFTDFEKLLIGYRVHHGVMFSRISKFGVSGCTVNFFSLC